MSPAEFTRQAARAWMHAEVDRARHGENTYDVTEPGGDLSPTHLAESCAQHFDVKDEGGPLDDESHWIWEVALEVVDAAQQADEGDDDGR